MSLTFIFEHVYTFMNQSTIKIDVLLDSNKVPQQISWSATDSSIDTPQKAKAMCIAFWDGVDKTALRIDLWTNDMMIDEMADFYYQMFSTMADTFERATKQIELSDDIKNFAQAFQKKFRAIQMKEEERK